MKSRLDRIEATLEKIAQVQLHNQELLSTLMTSVSAFVDSSNAYVAAAKRVRRSWKPAWTRSCAPSPRSTRMERETNSEQEQ